MDLKFGTNRKVPIAIDGRSIRSVSAVFLTRCCRLSIRLRAKRPVFGRDAVITLLIGFRRSAPSAGVNLADVSLDVAEVNGEPAMLLRVAGHLDSVYTFTFEGAGIAAIRVVRNPDKLQFIERQLTAN